MECLLRSALVLSVTCASALAGAEPVVYEFEGHIVNRSVAADIQNTDRYEHLPSGFAPGTKFKGRVTYDRALRYHDADAEEERASPVTNIWIRTEAGAYVSSVGAVYRGGPSVDQMTPDKVRAQTVLFNQVTATDEFTAILGISWDGLNGELPEDNVGSFHLAAIEPECALEHCYRYEVATGYVTHARKAAPPAWTSNSWNFSSGAAGWTPRPGTTWTVSNGYYRNSSNVAASITLSNVAISGDFTFDASVYLEWSASGNRGGLVYDYRDDQNYRGVLVSANTNTSTSSGTPGAVEIFEVANGVRRVVATSTQTRFRNTWVPVSISRINGVTKINDVEVTQLPVSNAKVGLLARYNMVRFDDVVVSKPNSL